MSDIPDSNSEGKSLEWLAQMIRNESKKLEVDSGGENVRRVDEVKEPKSVNERSVYAVCLFFYTLRLMADLRHLL
jgi:hypothetical protein